MSVWFKNERYTNTEGLRIWSKTQVSYKDYEAPFN